MRKKLIAFISAALAVTVSCSAVSVIAVENMETQTNAEMSVSEEKLPETVYEEKAPVTGLPDPAELERMYIEKLFYGDNGISLYADYGRKELTGLELQIYNSLRKHIEAVANGTETSTEFVLTELARHTTLLEYSAIGSEFSKAESVAFQYLMVDLPGAFYWYDKTQFMSYGYTTTDPGPDGMMIMPRVMFPVGTDYMGADNTTVNPAKINAAKTAVANAKKIAAKYDGQSAYNKILGYKKEICDLVSYNDDAAKLSPSTAGINPWQLVWVFDENPSTNVVCEGYSKAFQYLCDLGGVECYTVTGYMNGGGHMWNIVVLGGKSYLVDITNCDGNSIGSPDNLLLKGASTSSASGCKFDNLRGLTYQYDADIIYPASILTVSTKDYVPTAVKGDINGDGKFDPLDLIALGKAYMNQEANKYFDIANMDGDNEITPIDIIRLGKLYMDMQK